MNRLYSYHFKQTFRRRGKLRFNQYNMAGADVLGLIFSSSQEDQPFLSDTLGTAGEELKGKGQEPTAAKQKPYFFFS